MAFKHVADMSSQNVYGFSYEQKAVVWLCVLYQHVLHFIVLEVKMPCSCSPKAKVIQTKVHKKNNNPSSGNKGMLSRIPTE